MRSIKDIESDLVAAQSRYSKAAKALAPKHKGGEWEEFRAASAGVLTLERELASAKGEEHAIPLDFPVSWDVGAPMPLLLRSDYRCLLIFYVAKVDPTWDGRRVTVVNPASTEPASLALVEFERCISAKLGSPNEDVLHGHPLSNKGLHAYTAQEVIHSTWLAEIEANNRVHRGYDASLWRSLHHYVFWFHDSTFECIARSVRVELCTESYLGLISRATQRLLD